MENDNLGLIAIVCATIILVVCIAAIVVDNKLTRAEQAHYYNMGVESVTKAGSNQPRFGGQ